MLGTDRMNIRHVASSISMLGGNLNLWHMIASTTQHRKLIGPLGHEASGGSGGSVVSKVDITTLISKMRDQYHSLRQHYEQQLEDIEQAFEEERKEMLQKNKVGNTMVGTRVFYDKQGSFLLS